MLVIEETLLVAPSRATGLSGRSFRYSLTHEKRGHYLTLEMPNKELAKRLKINPEGGDKVRISFLPSDAAVKSGLEDARYVIITPGGSTVLKKRGAATSNVRLGTYDINEAEVASARREFETDIEPTEVQVGESTGLLFRLPDWVKEEEEGEEVEGE